MEDPPGQGRIRELWLFDDGWILGGGQLFALRLAQFAAADRGLSVRVGCLADGQLASRCDAAGVGWFPASFPPLSPLGVPRWPGAILRTRSLLARAGPGTAAMANTPSAQAYLSVATPLLRPAARPPIVHVLHEQDTPARRSARFAFRRVGSLVAIGENVAAVCRARLPGVPVRKANNFLYPCDCEPAADPASGERPVVGVLARLIPEKGVLELVEELARAETWDRALIAGPAQDPAYTRRVEGRIAALDLGNRISLLGEIDDVPGFLGSVDVLVVPSTGSEAQPTVILEALAAGVACIVRSTTWSPDFEGLPVLPYDGAPELEARLRELPLGPVPAEEVRRRFGPEQALEAILAAAAPPEGDVGCDR
jgi:glycosyltransferase involved in cell wall biosynthesis